MLTLLAVHSFMDLKVRAQGDLEVDCHHTVEDVGIALGQAIAQALGDKKGIHRYGSFLLPMDEALAEIALDFSGRPYLVWNAEIIPRVTLGNFDTEMGEDFFRALAMNCGLTLHINVPYGKNTHHMLEAIFKGGPGHEPGRSPGSQGPWGDEQQGGIVNGQRYHCDHRLWTGESALRIQRPSESGSVPSCFRRPQGHR